MECARVTRSSTERRAGVGTGRRHMAVRRRRGRDRRRAPGRRFGGRRMLRGRGPLVRRLLPAHAVRAPGRSRTRPQLSDGRHAAEDPYRARSYWRFAEPATFYAPRSARRVSWAPMAPQLWMLRHGEAVPHDSKPDAERELTPRGERQSDAAGAALAAARRGVRRLSTRARRCGRARPPSSPARALEHRAGHRGRRSRTASTASTRSTLLDAPRRRRARAGRRPRAVASRRSSTTSRAARVDFKKGGVAALRVARAAGELIVLLRPRELEALAQALSSQR